MTPAELRLIIQLVTSGDNEQYARLVGLTAVSLEEYLRGVGKISSTLAGLSRLLAWGVENLPLKLLPEFFDTASIPRITESDPPPADKLPTVIIKTGIETPFGEQWSKSEDDYLRSEYRHSPQGCADTLGRTLNAVRRRAEFLGIRIRAQRRKKISQ